MRESTFNSVIVRKSRRLMITKTGLKRVLFAIVGIFAGGVLGGAIVTNYGYFPGLSAITMTGGAVIGYKISAGIDRRRGGNRNIPSLDDTSGQLCLSCKSARISQSSNFCTKCGAAVQHPVQMEEGQDG